MHPLSATNQEFRRGHMMRRTGKMILAFRKTNKVPVKNMITWLLRWGHKIDPEDMTSFDAWLYSCYLALEPFPSDHCRYREHCLDSFESPDKRLRAARSILRTVSKKANGSLNIRPKQVSPYYDMILNIFLRQDLRKSAQH